MKILTIIKVEQRHFFLLFLALLLDRLRRRFRFSCLEGDEKNLDEKLEIFVSVCRRGRLNTGFGPHVSDKNINK